LIPTHRVSGEYSRPKVPKVVVFSTVRSYDIKEDVDRGYLALL